MCAEYFEKSSKERQEEIMEQLKKQRLDAQTKLKQEVKMEVPEEKVEENKEERIEIAARIDETTNTTTPKKFSDVYGQQSFDFPGEQVNEKDVREKEMTIYDFALLNGQFGEFLVIDAELTEEMRIEVDKETGHIENVKRIQFAEGSDIIRKQLKKAKEDGNLPLIAKIEERTSEKSKMTYRTLI